MRGNINSFFASLLLTMLLLGSIPLFAVAAPLQLGPNLRQGNNRSLNWSGYAVTGSSGSFTSVSGSWTVPGLTCSRGTQYAAFWAGIDGFSSSTVEQTGVLAECSSGSAVYSAWYEFYPASPVYAPSSDAVKPGDVVSAAVTYSSSSGTFVASLTDATQGWTFTSSATSVSGAAQSSAECITERPSIGGSLTKLANFGIVYFGQDSTGVSSTCYANGNAFGSFGTSVQEITMVNFRGMVLAQPSGLSSDGSSFSVTWKASS